MPHFLHSLKFPMVPINDDYRPDIAIHPGETLIDVLEDMGMSQLELSTRTGIHQKTINEIVKGKNPITPENAIRFEKVLNVSASFWNNLQKNYDETLARLRDEEKLEGEISLVKEFTCYPELVKAGLVVPTQDLIEKAKNLLGFFRVNSLSLIPQIQRAAFRKASSKSISSYSLAAWLRWGEIKAESVKVGDFNKSLLIEKLPEIRKLTYLPKDFWKDLKEICNKCGLIVVFTPPFQNTKVCGATRWIGQTPLIQLSGLWKWSDSFWFTFFHEIGHIIKHGKKDEFIEFEEDGSKSDDEIEADKFAQDQLIPSKEFRNFIVNGNYTETAIINFAGKIDIDPSIVAGRLAIEERISWNKIPQLRKKLDDVTLSK